MRPPLPSSALRALMLTPPLGWMAFLWWLSSQPKPIGPEMSDKLAHVLAYALLAALWVRALRFTTALGHPRVGAIAAGVSLVYGVVDELHQSFVPGRDASLLDAAADATGAVLGALAATGLYALTSRMARDG